MKRVVWLNPEDMPEWDSFVSEHPYGWISHLSVWKEVLERSFKHIKGHFLAIRENDSNKILAGLPIYVVKSLLTGNRLVSVPLLSLNDALISSPKDMEALFPYMLNLYKDTKAAYVAINTWRSATFTPISPLHVHRFYKHHYIPLDRSLEELKKSFHKSSIQRKISQAIKSHLQLRVGETEEDLYSFHDIFSQTRKRLGLPLIPYRFFRSLWQLLGASGHMKVLLVVHKRQDVAGAVLLKYGDIVVSEFNCDTGEFRNLGVNQFCEWEAIKLAYQGGYKIYSFGRTSPMNKGLMTFKGRWGTKVDDLPTVFFPGSRAQNFVERESSWEYKLVAKISRKAPGFLFAILGKMIYRHMG